MDLTGLSVQNVEPTTKVGNQYDVFFRCFLDFEQKTCYGTIFPGLMNARCRCHKARAAKHKRWFRHERVMFSINRSSPSTGVTTHA